MYAKRSPDRHTSSAAPKRKALTLRFRLRHIKPCLHAHCIQALIPTLTCVSKQGHKNETRTRKYQKRAAQNMSVYGMMFHRRFKCAQINRSHQTSRAKDLQSNQIPPSLRLAVEKVQVIEHTVTSAKPWSAAGRSAVTEEPLTLRPRLPFLPPKTYIPSATSLHTAVWPLRSAGAVPLGDS